MQESVNDAQFAEQYGVRQGRTTKDAVLALMNNIHESLENKSQSFAILTDLSKTR